MKKFCFPGLLIFYIVLIIVSSIVSYQRADYSFEFMFLALGICAPTLWIVSALVFNFIKGDKSGAWESTIITSPLLLGLLSILLDISSSYDFIYYIFTYASMLISLVLLIYRLKKVI